VTWCVCRKRAESRRCPDWAFGFWLSRRLSGVSRTILDDVDWECKFIRASRSHWQDSSSICRRNEDLTSIIENGDPGVGIRIRSQLRRERVLGAAPLNTPACAAPSGKTVATEPTVTCSIIHLMFWTGTQEQQRTKAGGRGGTRQVSPGGGSRTTSAPFAPASSSVSLATSVRC
jgi:hypothetical protein